MYGDNINDLPLEEDSRVKDEDIQLLKHILRPSETSYWSTFTYKHIIIMIILIAGLSLPQVGNFIGFYVKNNTIIIRFIQLILVIILYLLIVKYIKF
jgi:hypothetical protein